jgi:hypothetical protein
MKRAVCFLVCMALSLLAQTGSSLTGKITDPDGNPVPTAIVQLKNTATEAASQMTIQTTTPASGEYAFTNLPAGTYDLTIPSLGFTFKTERRNGIVIGASARQRLDITMPWGGNLGTPGDDFNFAVRANHPMPSGATPRTSDGKPDFSGVWIGLQTATGNASLLPWADAIFKQRAANGGKDHPSTRCLPADVILDSPFVYKVVQKSELIVLLWEGNLPGVDQIFLDGRSHPANFFPTWMGHSVGHWEGDTLVVDSVGFNDQSWLGITPHTEQLHIVQRYSRPDLGHLEKDVTIEDPGAMKEPWKFHVSWELAPGEEVMEMVCEQTDYGLHVPRN